MSRPKAEPTGHAARARVELSGPETIVPAAPESLGAVGVAVWDEVWSLGAPSGAYQVSDRLVIARYAEMQERRAGFMARCESEGWTTVGSQGQLVLHPLARQIEAIESKLQGLEDRLGLNPESRLRMGITAVEHKSALQRFLEED